MLLSYNVLMSKEALLGNAVENRDKQSATCMRGFKRLNTTVESPFFVSVNPFLSIRVIHLQSD
jgi:hypothetical protein